MRPRVRQLIPKCGLESLVAPPLESEMGGYNSQIGLERGLKSLVTVLVAALVASSNRPFSWIARPIRGTPGRQTVLAGAHDDLERRKAKGWRQRGEEEEGGAVDGRKRRGCALNARARRRRMVVEGSAGGREARRCSTRAAKGCHTRKMSHVAAAGDSGRAARAL